MTAGGPAAAPVVTGLVEGPSFPWSVKAGATAVVIALVLWAVRTWDELQRADFGPGGLGFLVAVLIVVASGYWGILFSRTSFDGTTIRQSWLWKKEVRIEQITQVKHIHVRGLAWLLVPRLVVRTGGFAVTTFHAADPGVLAAFRALAYGEAEPR